MPVRGDSNSRPRLLVFADDWGRHPSSCQYLISQLLPRYTVYWVNTIGMRAPRWDLASVRRGLEKAYGWSRSSSPRQKLPDNLEVVNPGMWPWLRRPYDRWLNRQLLTRSLTRRLGTCSSPVVAITTIPIVADLVGRLPVQSWVYYCVDDFGSWPGLDGDSLRTMEAQLVAKVDRLIAAGDNLQQRLLALGRSSEVLTHGVDLDFWRTPSHKPPIPQLATSERPWIVFWGLIDRRMDVAFVAQLVRDLRQGTVVFIGPLQDPDPALLQLPRVVHVPALNTNDLPAMAAEAAVLIMPYADLPVTQAMQPLKLKEYLACERPVIVRDLPATRPWADCLNLATSPQEFSESVRRCLVEGLSIAQRHARARLTHESWSAKAREFEKMLTQGLMAVRS